MDRKEGVGRSRFCRCDHACKAHQQNGPMRDSIIHGSSSHALVMHGIIGIIIVWELGKGTAIWNLVRAVVVLDPGRPIIVVLSLAHEERSNKETTVAYMVA